MEEDEEKKINIQGNSYKDLESERSFESELNFSKHAACARFNTLETVSCGEISLDWPSKSISVTIYPDRSTSETRRFVKMSRPCVNFLMNSTRRSAISVDSLNLRVLENPGGFCNKVANSETARWTLMNRKLGNGDVHNNPRRSTSVVDFLDGVDLVFF